MNILKVGNLTKAYDDKCGVFGLDLSVDSGDIVLVLGPNGAGKTTTFQSILGLISSSYSEITAFSKPFNRTESLQRIGAMISKPVFYEYLTGEEHLRMLSGLYPNVTEVTVGDTLGVVGLGHAKNKRISQYSSGMKQRLDLARAIVHKPSLLILDEPFNGLDIEAKFDFKNLLLQLQKEYEMGILISSHMAGDLEHFANKVLILYEGQTLYSGSFEPIDESGLTLEAFYLKCLDDYRKGVKQ
jgi:ABC-2 type transport system ATP-binding protein